MGLGERESARQQTAGGTTVTAEMGQLCMGKEGKDRDVPIDKQNEPEADLDVSPASPASKPAPLGPLPPPWQEHTDPASGNQFYWNPDTQESQFARPPPPPPGSAPYVPKVVETEPEPEPEPKRVPTTPEQLHRAAHPGPLFNTTLEEAAKRSDPEGLVPAPVRHCCARLRKNCLAMEGLFRIPGSRKRCNEIIQLYDEDPCFELPDDEYGFNVTSVLVRFLQLLKPDKLWGSTPEQAYAFQKTISLFRGKSDEDVIRGLKVELWKMPAINRTTLELITAMLQEASLPENTETNLMSPTAFGMCLTPAIQMGMSLMVQHHDALFKSE